jgi:hypothetical protein
VIAVAWGDTQIPADSGLTAGAGSRDLDAQKVALWSPVAKGQERPGDLPKAWQYARGAREDAVHGSEQA